MFTTESRYALQSEVSFTLLDQIDSEVNELLNQLNKEELNKAYINLLKEDEDLMDINEQTSIPRIDPKRIISSPGKTSCFDHIQYDTNSKTQEETLTNLNLTTDTVCNCNKHTSNNEVFLVEDDSIEELEELLKDLQYISQHPFFEYSDISDYELEDPSNLYLQETHYIEPFNQVHDENVESNVSHSIDSDISHSQQLYDI